MSARPASQDLDARSRRARAVLRSAIDFAVIVMGRDGLITDWNSGATQVLGWTEQEMLGRPIDRIFTPQDRAEGRMQLEMRLALEGGRADNERWHVKADGSRFWASGEMMPLRDDDGSHIGYMKILRDRTAERNLERRSAALLELGDALRDMTDTAEMSFVAARIMGETLGVDRAGFGIMNFDEATLLIERDWTAAGIASVAGPHLLTEYGSFIDEMRRGVVVIVGDAAADPRTRENAARLDDVSGTAFVNLPIIEQGRLAAVYFVNSARPRNWAPDEIVFMRKVADRARGAIERRRAESDLRRLATSLEQQVAERTSDRNRLWQLSRDVMLVARFDGTITAVNPAWTQVLGWREEELLATSLFDLIHPDDLEATIEGARSVEVGETLLRFENRYRRKDGDYRMISWTAVPGDGLINAVGRDITEEHERQKALHAMEEQLHQAQKMEAVGQLTGGLAHDFNNLLTGVTGNLELLQRRIAQGRVSELDRYANAAHGAVKRAAALTHRLLAFSRRQTLDARPTSVNRLVVGMEDLIRRTVGPAIELEVVTAAGLWTAMVDAHQLESALLNLCINARDAMPEGGRLMIETANHRLDEAAARSHDLPPGQYVSLCVSDDGCGMSPEVRERAFEPFFTTKPIGLGTGLGLSMVYGFARQSGGQVRIDSELGRGTTMCIHLPRHHGDAGREAPQAEAAMQPVVGMRTVMVVDDEPTVRMLAVEVLEDLGYSTVEAGDGVAALRLLQSSGTIDLLITDVGLPNGMNGRQLADAARVSRPDLKVLFITGYAEHAVIGHSHLEHGMQVLTKPFTLEALAARVQELVEDD